MLHRAAGDHPEAAEELARFLDEQSTKRVEQYLLDHGLPARDARDRAEAVDALVLGLSTRRRVLRTDLGEVQDLERWLAAALQRLVDSDAAAEPGRVAPSEPNPRGES